MQSYIVLEKGTIVDATIKQAQTTPQSKKDNDAGFTTKRGKHYFGYKRHIAMDKQSEVIKQVAFTKASVHDSKVLINWLTEPKKQSLQTKGMPGAVTMIIN